MSHGKQFTLFTHVGGPNGWKVAIVLEELGLTYESKYLDFQKGEQKAPEHTRYNPNGRIPTLIDHTNGDFAVWESNAILLYLVDRYDKEKRLTVTGEKDTAALIQWLFFQASGQGPYFGQAMWFMRFHHEQLPSAIERYQNETKRVFGVLDGVLAKSEWLVGDKCTIADLSFIPWNRLAIMVPLKDVDVEKEFPHVWAWHNKMLALPGAKKALEVQASLQK